MLKTMATSRKCKKVELSEQQLCYTIGYLLSGRLFGIGAQVPESLVEDFKKEYNCSTYMSTIKEKMTPSGLGNKLSSQYSIHFKDITNLPVFLKPLVRITYASDKTVYGVLHRSSFIEELVTKYGFSFGPIQNRDLILQNVIRYHSDCFEETVKGMLA